MIRVEIDVATEKDCVTIWSGQMHQLPSNGDTLEIRNASGPYVLYRVIGCHHILSGDTKPDYTAAMGTFRPRHYDVAVVAVQAVEDE